MDFIAQLTTPPASDPNGVIWRILLPFSLVVVGLTVIALIIRVLFDRLLSGFGRRQIDIQDLPEVQLNKKFISYAEADFYRVLQHIVGDRGIILAQVALNRLLFFPGNNQTNPGRQTWWNKTSRKSVDFVIVDPKTLTPLVIIELNDSSHDAEERVIRDEEVAAILSAAGIPLETVRCARSYDPRAMARLLEPYFQPPASATSRGR